MVRLLYSPSAWRNSSLAEVLARVCASTCLTMMAAASAWLPSFAGRVPGTTTEPAGTRPRMISPAFTVINTRALADEHTHGNHAAALHHHAFDNFRTRADEAIVFNYGGVRLQGFKHTADAHAAAQVHIAANLGTGTDRGPGVDHGAGADPSADVHVAGHQHRIGADIGATADQRSGHDACARGLDTGAAIVESVLQRNGTLSNQAPGPPLMTWLGVMRKYSSTAFFSHWLTTQPASPGSATRNTPCSSALRTRSTAWLQVSRRLARGQRLALFKSRFDHGLHFTDIHLVHILLPCPPQDPAAVQSTPDLLVQLLAAWPRPAG